MDTQGERIKFARENATGGKLSQRTLGESVGVTQQMIWKLENNLVKDTSVLIKIGMRTGFRPEWLEAGLEPRRHEKEPSNVSPGPAIKGMVPLISWVSAGRWREPDVSLDAPLEWLPVTFATPNVFALRIEGDSMEPDFPPGTIIFIDPDRKAEPMSLVIARNGDDEATFKRLTREGGIWYLAPLNPRYPLQKLDSLCRIIGVVIMASRWTA